MGKTYRRNSVYSECTKITHKKKSKNNKKALSEKMAEYSIETRVYRQSAKQKSVIERIEKDIITLYLEYIQTEKLYNETKINRTFLLKLKDEKTPLSDKIAIRNDFFHYITPSNVVVKTKELQEIRFLLHKKKRVQAKHALLELTLNESIKKAEKYDKSKVKHYRLKHKFSQELLKCSTIEIPMIK